MDVVALGELLIDFTENGTSAQDNKLFEANPGGAPCNVLAMLQKLGHQTAFIGKVGQDAFGRLLVDAVKEQGIDTTGVRYDDTVETTGAGDTFCACLLHDVLEHGINDRKDDDVKKMLTFANAAASLITTRKGALRVMPEKGEVEAVIK